MTAARAIVFDFDGVLADSEPLHLAAYQEIFAAMGVILTRDEYYANLLGYTDEDVFRIVGAQHGWNWNGGQIAALISQKSEIFERVYGSGGVLYPGAAACIERLAAAFPLGIASGALRHEIETVLTSARLVQHFRFIVGAGETPNSKPSPDPYLRAAELHGLEPSECVAIEDSRWGIESAKTAGMKCVGITNPYPASELTTADFVITSLDEFTEALIRTL
jgi:HAD superfamily hydrolase (TIGR01509 family)